MKKLIFLLFFSFCSHAKTFRKDFTDITQATKNIFGPELAQHAQRVLRFDHSNTEAPKSLVILIHGTFSSNNKNYYADSTRCFESIKEFARDIRTNSHTTVDLMSFGWNGLNTDEARIHTGKQLAAIINTHYSTKEYTQIITVAQSHGGNIANIATHFVTSRAIDIMIHLATPVREDDNDLYRPINFGTLYAFYSKSDPVQYLGSFDMNAIRKTGNVAFAKKRHFEGDGKNTIYNIHTQINSYCPGHLELRDIFIALFTILEEINSFTIHRSLELNVDLNDFQLLNTNNEYPILVAIKDELKEHTNHEQFSYEITKSNHAKQQYKELYEKDIMEYISKSTYGIRKIQKRSSNFRDDFSEFLTRYA